MLEDEDGMNPLERRCRLLLRVYPAAYREIRGEEIIGTLLEATPSGRSWPRPQDMRGLLAGGFRARAAQPRQFTTAGNLRAAVLAGVAAYLVFTASGVLISYLRVGFVPTVEQATVIGTPLFGWPLAAVMLSLIPMALVWLSRRRVVVLLSALPAAAATSYAGPWQGFLIGSPVVRLACIAVLVVLAGYAERPAGRWVWPLGLLAIAPLLLGVAGRLAGMYLLMAVLAFAILCIAWMVIDARPAIAMTVFLLGFQLFNTIGFLAIGGGFELPTLFALVMTAITAVTVWRLRCQSAHPARPTQTS
jgi:hypothetical protein